MVVAARQGEARGERQEARGKRREMIWSSLVTDNDGRFFLPQIAQIITEWMGGHCPRIDTNVGEWLSLRDRGRQETRGGR